MNGAITHNANNELEYYGDISYDYDANGNMVSKTSATETRQYIYNVQNRLVRVEDGSGTVIAEYSYDPFGRRLWKEVEETRTYFFYSDEGLVAEYDKNGNELRSYGYRPDSIWTTDPLWLKESGDYYWYQNDHLSTSQMLIDSAGNTVWSAMYTAFGKAQIQIETVTNHLRFPGQYDDVETGLYYNWFRYYAPTVGRYLRVDPIGFQGGDVNLYAYVWNNPIQLLDPLGLASGECVKGLNECIVRKAKEYVGRTDIGDCADVAFTVLIECAAELSVSVSFPYREARTWKYYRSKDSESTEKFAKFIRAMMGSINLYDNPTKSKDPRITKLKDLEQPQPGDLILYDLRFQGGDYDGHTKILVGINEDAWFWPYIVVEGHMHGTPVEESRYAMDGLIFDGLIDHWRGPAHGKARTWDCSIFR